MISKNQIKHIKALHLKKFRDEQECFIAEGKKLVDEIVLHRAELVNEIFATSDYYKKNKTAFEKKDIAFYEVGEEELARISMQNNPNQVLAVCSYFKDEKSS